MDVDFFFGVLVVDLLKGPCTILMATISLFSVFLASLTSPYEPNPTMSTFPI